jgi:hypothetical protein
VFCNQPHFHSAIFEMTDENYHGVPSVMRHCEAEPVSPFIITLRSCPEAKQWCPTPLSTQPVPIVAEGPEFGNWPRT